MAANTNRLLNGLPVGWSGVITRFVGAITPSDTTEYSPPLRVLTITGNGNIVVVYEGDPNTSDYYDTIAVTAGQEITNRAVRLVRATNTTATLKAYR